MKLIPVKKQMSWITKEALAAPFTGKQEKELGEKGLVQIPDTRDKYPKGKKGGRKGSWGYKDIIKEVGAEDLFQTDDPKLRTWLKLNAKKIVVIEGQEYVVWHTKKPTKKDTAGQILAIGPLVRTEDGKIDSDKSSFKPQEFAWDKYADQIQLAPDIIQKQLDEVNVEIQHYNDFVGKTIEKMKEGKTASVTVLPLQIKHAEEAIERRLKTLEAQKKSIEEGAAKTQEQTAAGMGAIEETYESVKGGQDISPQDYAILLLERKFHSVATLEQLRNEIGQEQMPFDQETNAILIKFILAVIDWQIQEREAEKAKRQEEQVAREERKEEEDLPEMQQMFLQKVAPIEKLKGTYQKAKKFYSPEAMGSSSRMATGTIDQDYSELSSVLGSLQQARNSVIELPTKTNEYITGDGAFRLQEIQAFINSADLFVKRYKTSPFVDTEAGLELNPKLLGTSGTLGNVIVAMALRQIILSVDAELTRIKAGKQPGAGEKIEQVKEPVKEPVQEPIQATQDLKIKRLSEIFWQSFENKWRLK